MWNPFRPLPNPMLAAVERALAALTKEIQTMAITIQQLKDATDTNHGVIAQMVVAVNSFPDKLAAAVAAATAGDQATAQAILDEANADRQSMTDALAKLTPPA